jgi:hypothetical protein
MTGYEHPATGRLNELLRKGWQIIASDVSQADMRKGANTRTYREGTVWLTTGDVLAPPAKSQNKKDAA